MAHGKPVGKNKDVLEQIERFQLWVYVQSQKAEIAWQPS